MGLKKEIRSGHTHFRDTLIIPERYGKSAFKTVIGKFEDLGFGYTYQISDHKVEHRGIEVGDYVFDVEYPVRRKKDLFEIMQSVRPKK